MKRGKLWLNAFLNPFFSFSFREKGKRTAFSFCFSKKKTPGKRKKRPGKPFGWFPRTPSIDQSLALDLRRMEVLDFAVFAGREMTAIIKIACGVVKFQMAKLCPSETVTIWEGRRRLRIWSFRRPGGNGMEPASSDAAAILFFLYKEKEKNGGAKTNSSP